LFVYQYYAFKSYTNNTWNIHYSPLNVSISTVNLKYLQVNRTTGVQNGWSEAVRRNFTPYYTTESQMSAKLFGSSAVCRVTHHRGRRGKKTASLSASIAGWEFARTTTTGRWRYATSHLMTQVSTGLPSRTNLEKYKPQLDSKCWVSIYLRP